MTNVELPPKLHCNQCDYEWTPRQSDVRRCARCKSPYWDKPKKEKKEGKKG